MIGYLSGKVKFLFGESCILDVGGVGYNVVIDEQTRQDLAIGEATELFIYTAVKEDAINLFGFKSRETATTAHLMTLPIKFIREIFSAAIKFREN